MRLYDDLLTNGYYTTRQWIGTPPQIVALIVDTGSTVTYVPCSDCEACGNHQLINLAIALANKCGMKVGLLDADVYGPNVPIMMKLEGKPKVTKGSVEHEKVVTASQFQSHNHFANASIVNGI